MKRWYLAVAISIGFICALAGTSRADVASSHHDMNTWSATGGDTCYPCHGYRETGAAAADLGRVGTMCYLRCHVGDSGQAGTITLDTAAPERGAWPGDNTVTESAYSFTARDKYATGHAMTRTDIPLPDTTASWPAGWPYIDQDNIECTTCHDVHSNTNAPFLRGALSDNATRANAFCHQCHRATGDGAARWVDLYNALPNGSHPSEVGWGAGQGARSGSRLGRTIAFKDIINGTSDNNGVFRNVSPSGTALNGNTTNYNPGGKLGDFGMAGNVGCYSCHAVHIPSGAGTSQQTVAVWKGLLTNNVSIMCVGCHGASGTDGRNPGATAYFHPANAEAIAVDNTSATASTYNTTTANPFLIVVNVDTADRGPNSRIVCSSCHGSMGSAVPNGRVNAGAHYGPAGSMVLSYQKPACSSCHNVATAQMGTAPNSHHVYGGGAARGAQYGTWGYPDNVTYSGSGATAVVGSITNGLSCEDCHFFNGTAHNWN